MAFDTQRAVLYGQFIEAAYTMYGGAPTNVTPPASSDFPAGYTLTAWVQMRDFSVFGSTGLVFYGFIAHSNTGPHRAILAVRGTDTDLEWWDDISSLGMTPFDVPDCGNVGLGWENIYQTLEVVPVAPGGGAQPSLKPVGRFAAQVKAHLQSHATAAGTPRTAATPHPIEITGHSLGAALATLCAAENALLYKTEVSVQALYTFASPKMGDSTFVNKFNGLGLDSWRIINEQDIVQYVPPGFFEHVNTAQPFDSRGKVQQSISCCHAIATYLSLLDPALKPDPACRLPAPAAAASA